MVVCLLFVFVFLFHPAEISCFILQVVLLDVVCVVCAVACVGVCVCVCVPFSVHATTMKKQCISSWLFGLFVCVVWARVGQDKRRTT